MKNKLNFSDVKCQTMHLYLLYEPPRKLEEIESDINGLESDILKLLHEVTR